MVKRTDDRNLGEPDPGFDNKKSLILSQIDDVLPAQECRSWMGRAGASRTDLRLGGMRVPAGAMGEPGAACRAGVFTRSSARIPTGRLRAASRLGISSVVAALFLLAAIPEDVAGDDDGSGTTNSLKKLSLQDLLDLEVTSVSRRPEPLVETASAVQVITGHGIRRSGATNLADTLRLATNLQVAQKGSHGWGISARGFNTDLANKLLVLVDGRTVYTPLFSGVFWDRQDYLLEDVERIEVISGPGGTLWGANAVNGVVSITSKDTADTLGTLVEAGAGTHVRQLFGARFGGSLGQATTFRVYGKYSDREGSVRADGGRLPDDWQLGQGGFRIDAGGHGGDRLTLQGDLFSERMQSTGGDDATASGGNVLGRWVRRLSDSASIRVQAYFDRTRFSMDTKPYVIRGITLAPAGTFVDDLDTYDLEIQHNFRADPVHRIVWGAGYRITRDSVENSPGLAFLPPVLEQRLFSAFAQDEMRLSSALAVAIGSKVEHNSYTGWEVEPGVRAQWEWTESHRIWAAVSRVVRMPSRIDRDLAQPAPPHLVVLSGDPSFRSESAVAYELGHRMRLGSGVVSSLSGYVNDYEDVRSTTVTPGTILPFHFGNDLEGRTYGFELSVLAQVSPTNRLQFGYNLLIADLRVRPGGADINNALNETADPRHQVSLGWSVDLPRGLSLDTHLRWVDSLTMNNGGTPATVPSYAELDVCLRWAVSERVELSVTGRNLLHDQHPEYGVPGANRAEVERGVMGKITWRH